MLQAPFGLSALLRWSAARSPVAVRCRTVMRPILTARLHDGDAVYRSASFVWVLPAGDSDDGIRIAFRDHGVMRKVWVAWHLRLEKTDLLYQDRLPCRQTR